MIGFYLTLIDDENDKVTFECLYNEQHKNLIAAALKITNDHQLAEDAVSEMFLKISRNFHKLRKLDKKALDVYCKVAVKNISLSLISSTAPETPNENVIISKNAFENEVLKNENAEYLKEKISQLTYIDNEILTLYYYYDLKLREIADIKKISVESAKKRLQTARKRLKEALEEDDYEG